MTGTDTRTEYILSYNVLLQGYTQFLPNSVLFHRKRETNTLYTINALNDLIQLLNNGVLDTHYKIDWERYRDIMLIKNVSGMRRLKLENVEVFTA